MNHTDSTPLPTQTPRKIILRPRINPRKAGLLKQDGIGEQKRDDLMVRAGQIAGAVELGKNPFRFQRKDATGIKRADDGSPIFDKQGLRNASLKLLIADMKEAGYALTSANLWQKENDHMFFLYLGYEIGGKPMELTPSAEEAIGHILSQTYESVHVWDNTKKNSFTVNPNHALPDHLGPVHEVRFQNGQFSEKLIQSVTV